MTDEARSHLFGTTQQSDDDSPSPFYMNQQQQFQAPSTQQQQQQQQPLYSGGAWPPSQSPQYQGYPPQRVASPSGLDFYSGSAPDESGFAVESMSTPSPGIQGHTESMAGLFDHAALEEDYANEPPLLEELDINFEHILGKTRDVLLPFKRASNLDKPDELLMDSDLTGPIFFLICLGCSLLLQGKVQFGSIYGFGVFGCAALYVLLNLLSPPAAPPIDFWQVMSTLGYCLLPVVLVAVVGIVVNLTGVFGNAIAAISILWCTYTATRNFERLLSMNKQRFLIAYPIGLLYSIFVLITIF